MRTDARLVDHRCGVAYSNASVLGDDRQELFGKGGKWRHEAFLFDFTFENCLLPMQSAYKKNDPVH